MIYKVRYNVITILIQSNMIKSSEYTTIFKISHGILHGLYLDTYYNSRIGPLSVGLDKFTIKIYIYSTD